MRALCGEGGDGPGVDLVEVGMPYSDPMMDGPVIQRAGTRALARGVRTRDVFAAVEAVAHTGTPAVVMTYWNLIDRYGLDALRPGSGRRRRRGTITPDLIPDEAEAWIAASDAHGLDRVFLVSPSSTDERIAATAAAGRGWVYATVRDGGDRDAVVSVDGRARSGLPDPAGSPREPWSGWASGCRTASRPPRSVGYADGVIVGSAFLKPLLAADDAHDPGDLSGLRAVLADLVAGVRR